MIGLRDGLLTLVATSGGVDALFAPRVATGPTGLGDAPGTGAVMRFSDMGDAVRLVTLAGAATALGDVRRILTLGGFVNVFWGDCEGSPSSVWSRRRGHLRHEVTVSADRIRLVEHARDRPPVDLAVIGSGSGGRVALPACLRRHSNAALLVVRHADLRESEVGSAAA